MLYLSMHCYLAITGGITHSGSESVSFHPEHITLNTLMNVLAV